MAIMIPNALSPDIKSAAEKHIFDWFQNAPGLSLIHISEPTRP